MNEMKPEDVMYEYTEEEIIKAWEDEVALGKDIGLKRDFINYVSISLVNATLALLREKDAEIERLHGVLAEVNRLATEVRNDLPKAYAEARIKAINEFAERIKTFYAHLGGKTVGGSVEYHVEQVKRELLARGADTCVS